MAKTYKQFTEEQSELGEILGFAARKQAGRRMKLLAKKASHKFKMKLKKMKAMPMKDGERLGAKADVNMVKQKLVGKAKDMKDLGISQKMRIEKMAKKKMQMMGAAKIKMLTKKFAKGIIKKHREASIKMKQKGAEDSVHQAHSDAKKAGVDPKVIAKSKEKHLDKIDKHADDHVEKGDKDVKKSDDKKSGFKGFMKKMFGKKDK